MMSGSSANLFAPDMLVHQPTRLAILTVLMACRMADFLFLQTTTGFTPANVSSHVATLEDAGLVLVTRTFRGKRRYTTVQVTPEGRLRYAAYWRDLDAWREQLAGGRFSFRDRTGPE
jgi:DNA-binding MarR family transcriptional regulator